MHWSHPGRRVAGDLSHQLLVDQSPKIRVWSRRSNTNAKCGKHFPNWSSTPRPSKKLRKVFANFVHDVESDHQDLLSVNVVQESAAGHEKTQNQILRRT
jgi:hypothetical protein